MGISNLVSKARNRRIAKKNLAVAAVEREEAELWQGTSRAKKSDPWVLSASLEEVALATGTGTLNQH